MFGHDKIVNFFDRVILGDALAHAYIISGPKGVGKKKIANWIAGRVLSLEKIQKIDKEEFVIHSDLIRVKKDEDKKNISIEQIRNLRNRVKRSSFEGGFRVNVIEDIELMTQEAANALLKTLEEPGIKNLFLLLTSQVKQIPDTIKSRCQIVSMTRHTKEKLREILVVEGIKKSEQAIDLARGLPVLAIELALDEEFLLRKKSEAKELFRVLESRVSERFFILDGLFEKKVDIDKKNVNILSHLNTWSEVVRDMALYNLGLKERMTHKWAEKDIEKQVKFLNIKKVFKLQEALQITLKDMVSNVNTKLSLSNTFLSI